MFQLLQFRFLFLFSIVWTLLAGTSAKLIAEPSFPLQAKRIVFIGDSITNAGGYIAHLEAQLRLQNAPHIPEFINIGLSSETCTGLSEPSHPFPRPNVHERLDRVLKEATPDVVVACYGMNDGIYHPFDEQRFASYQQAIGVLIDKVHAAGAKLVLMTPPPFDAEPLRAKGIVKPAGEKQYAYNAPYEKYNDEVLARYGQWLMEQKDRVEMVIDLQTPILQALVVRRKSEPKFTFAGDGVHPNEQGHQILAETLLTAWGIPSQLPPPAPVLNLVSNKMSLIRDAWLSHVGHLRPGVKAGLPLAEANAKAEAMLVEISAAVSKAQKPEVTTRASTDGTVYHVAYLGSLQPDALRLSVEYFLWVPNSSEKLRGVIVHQHGCGVGACLGGRTAADDLHWQALAKKWNCALLGSSYEPREGVDCRLWCDARKGSDQRFLQSLQEFAKATDRAELTEVPWCLWGHSGGAFWASLMQAKYPERIVAIWLRSGTAFGYWQRGEITAPVLSEAVFQIPVMANPGAKERDHERFKNAWDGSVAMLEAYRKQGSPFFLAPDPRTSHECGDSRYLAIPFFDLCLDQRLPANHGEPLRPFLEKATAWQQDFAKKWSEYKESGGVSDESPPPAPTEAVALRQGDSVVVQWNASADFESGIGRFDIFRDGQRIGQVPEKPVGRFGRPLFQQMSYHDTPEAPLPKMEFVDQAPAPSATKTPIYSIKAINSVGLESVHTVAEFKTDP